MRSAYALSILLMLCYLCGSVVNARAGTFLIVGGIRNGDFVENTVSPWAGVELDSAPPLNGSGHWDGGAAGSIGLGESPFSGDAYQFLPVNPADGRFLYLEFYGREQGPILPNGFEIKPPIVVSAEFDLPVGLGNPPVRGVDGPIPDFNSDRWQPISFAFFLPATWNNAGDSSLHIKVNNVDGSSGNYYFFLDYVQLQQIPLGELIPGDFDLDRNVDGADFVAWQTHFPTASGATVPDGDADWDGDVDGADFVVWQTNFPYPPGSAVAVPEPQPMLLAIIGGFGLSILCWQRRGWHRLSADCAWPLSETCRGRMSVRRSRARQSG